jgi:hypothetical protein
VDYRTIQLIIKLDRQLQLLDSGRGPTEGAQPRRSGPASEAPLAAAAKLGEQAEEVVHVDDPIAVTVVEARRLRNGSSRADRPARRLNPVVTRA